MAPMRSCRQAATKRYKQLHETAFRDDKSKANYLRLVQTEKQSYETLIAQLEPGSEVGGMASPAKPFLQQVVLGAHRGEAAPAADSKGGAMGCIV